MTVEFAKSNIPSIPLSDRKTNSTRSGQALTYAIASIVVLGDHDTLSWKRRHLLDLHT
jgi:hypothetical protein